MSDEDNVMKATLMIDEAMGNLARDNDFTPSEIVIAMIGVIAYQIATNTKSSVTIEQALDVYKRLLEETVYDYVERKH